MYIDERRYPVMDGEPQLGSMTESTVVEEEEGEAVDLILEWIVANGYMPDEIEVQDSQTGFDIFIDPSDYLENHEYTMLEKFLEDTDVGQFTMADLNKVLNR